MGSQVESIPPLNLSPLISEWAGQESRLLRGTRSVVAERYFGLELSIYSPSLTLLFCWWIHIRSIDFVK
jgi:hypothetical protein